MFWNILGWVPDDKNQSIKRTNAAIIVDVTR
jgi:hypothetical protein